MINSIPKDKLKKALYLVEQSKEWIIWHGTLSELKESLLGSCKRIKYSLDEQKQ